MAAYTTIDNPELYFQAKLHTGNATNRSITLDGSEDMQPDFVWIKQRSSSNNHELFDAVRGATKRLYSDVTNVEDTGATTLTSFDSDGFSLGTGNPNNDGGTYVSWCWKESATAGFDIVSFTGNGSARTISHSLSAKPEFFVVKSRTYGEQWECYSKKLGATKCLQWDDDSAEADIAGRFNDTEPTSSVFTVGDADAVNKNTYTYVTYLWRSVQGFSKMGSYTGNGNADGPMIWTGFRPAFLMVKKSSGTGNWVMSDNKRSVFNRVQNTLYANVADAELTDGVYFDLLSNGFKIKDASSANNTSGGTYIYMAFAEAPFVNSNGVPCNAR